MAPVGPFSTQAEAQAACDSDDSSSSGSGVNCACGIVDAPNTLTLTGWGGGSITLTATILNESTCVWRGTDDGSMCESETTIQFSCTSGGIGLSLWCGGIGSTALMNVIPTTVISLNPIHVTGSAFFNGIGTMAECGVCYQNQYFDVSLTLTE